MDSDSCCKIVLLLQELFNEKVVDKGHGTEHALKVLTHVDNALVLTKIPEKEEHRQAIRYAALLHDADDIKFFPKSLNYENARSILKKIFPRKEKLETLVIKMIKLVSCSENGNSLEGLDEKKYWMLIPRLCDRLEAVGEIGILRTWTYNKHINRPLFLATTPKCITEEEIKNIATSERFEKYIQEKNSESMIDHFYDKVLHISTPEALYCTDNPYIKTEARKRNKIVIDFIIQFGKEGVVDIRELNRIRAKMWK
jgi:uncharacterized protein